MKVDRSLTHRVQSARIYHSCICMNLYKHPRAVAPIDEVYRCSHTRIHSRIPFQSEAFRPKDSIALHRCERSQAFDTSTQAGRQSNWLSHGPDYRSGWQSSHGRISLILSCLPGETRTEFTLFRLVWPISLQDSVLKLFLRRTACQQGEMSGPLFFLEYGRYRTVARSSHSGPHLSTWMMDSRASLPTQRSHNSGC